MKNKKGFTLVELLAVIAILAILVIIALPNVLDMFNQAKIGTFVTEAQTVFKSAQQDFLLNNSTVNAFSNLADKTTGTAPNITYVCKKLNMTGNTKLQYYVKLDSYGKVTDYYVYDSTYAFYYHGDGLKIEKIEEEATKACGTTIKCGLYNKADATTSTTFPGNSTAVTGYNYVVNAVGTSGTTDGKNPCK